MTTLCQLSKKCVTGFLAPCPSPARLPWTSRALLGLESCILPEWHAARWRGAPGPSTPMTRGILASGNWVCLCEPCDGPSVGREAWVMSWPPPWLTCFMRLHETISLHRKVPASAVKPHRFPVVGTLSPHSLKLSGKRRALLAQPGPNLRGITPLRLCPPQEET